MSDPSPKECLFKRGGVSSLEHWSGSIFTKSVGKDLTELTSPEIREKRSRVYSPPVFFYPNWKGFKNQNRKTPNQIAMGLWITTYSKTSTTRIQKSL